MIFKKIMLKLLKMLRIRDLFFNFLRNRTKNIQNNNFRFTLSIPNEMCLQRALTLASKEPETLEWIDGFPSNSTLWDVGANVGLYSVYAAKTKSAKVYSFEPSVFNLETLASNIHLNGLSSLVTIIPIALNDKTGEGELNMTSTELGGALSTFDKSYGCDGRELDVVFKYSLISITMDEALSKLNLKAPDYIKIDVDGIEPLILRGGANVLRRVKGVLIELTGLWIQQTEECEQLLVAGGLTKTVANTWHPQTNPFGSQNQIWVRK